MSPGRLIAIIVGAALSSCAYHPIYDPNAPEECRSLQSLIEARERYGIVAPSQEQDLDALRRCGLPYHYGGGPTPSQAPAGTVIPDAKPMAETSQDEVQLELHNGVFAVPVVINRAVSIPFVLDTGAADVQLPADVVLTLVRSGTLTESDFIGRGSYVLADGSTLRSARFNIRELRVGDHVVRNVTASLGSASSDPLLGQSFLSRVGTWTLDNSRHVLILTR
jgi:clan AA aspartic protease (TIGR02281 family)